MICSATLSFLRAAEFLQLQKSLTWKSITAGLYFNDLPQWRYILPSQLFRSPPLELVSPPLIRGIISSTTALWLSASAELNGTGIIQLLFPQKKAAGTAQWRGDQLCCQGAASQDRCELSAPCLWGEPCHLITGWQLEHPKSSKLITPEEPALLQPWFLGRIWAVGHTDYRSLGNYKSGGSYTLSTF